VDEESEIAINTFKNPLRSSRAKPNLAPKSGRERDTSKSKKIGRHCQLSRARAPEHGFNQTHSFKCQVERSRLVNVAQVSPVLLPGARAASLTSPQSRRLKPSRRSPGGKLSRATAKYGK
jgi:hypothetical protein